MIEHTDAELEQIQAVAGELSADILEFLQAELIKRGLGADVAGFILLCTYGRLAGRYGNRNIPFDEMYKQSTSENLKPTFKLGFDTERELDP